MLEGMFWLYSPLHVIIIHTQLSAEWLSGLNPDLVDWTDKSQTFEIHLGNQQIEYINIEDYANQGG